MANENRNTAGHTAQAREFLNRASQHLAEGDLHQASEKGWGAAAHMAKAVAITQGWEYERHSQFHQIMNQVRQQTGNDRVRQLHGRAEVLHMNFYELARGLDLETIRLDLENMAELLNILEPLAIK